MYTLGLLAFSSFVLALVLTPLCRNLLRTWGVVDRPDLGRHLQSHPIPRGGGIAVIAAYLGAFAVLTLSSLQANRILEGSFPLVWKVIPATALVFVIGLDDLRGIRPWQKFAGQAVAGCLVFTAGIQVTAVLGFALPWWVSLPVTVLWLVGCSNAFNLGISSFGGP